MIVFSAMTDSPDDRNLFEQVYTEHRDALYHCAYHILQDNATSEDAVHDAFLSLAKNFGRYQHLTKSQMRNFLIITVRNAAFKLYNRRKRETAVDEIWSEEELPDAAVDTEQKDSKRLLFDLIKTMDRKYGDVIILKYYCDLSITEIAEQLSLTEDNVKVRLYRARALLKKKLEEVGIHDRQGI